MMEQRWTRARRNGLILVLLSGAFSLFWGIVLTRTVPGGVLDLQGLYYGSQCLLHHCDPYNVQELEQFYRTQGVEDPTPFVQQSFARPKSDILTTMFTAMSTFRAARSR